MGRAAVQPSNPLRLKIALMLTMASVLLSAVHFLAFDQYRFPEFLSYAALLVVPTWIWLSRQMRAQNPPVSFGLICKRGLWCLSLLGAVALAIDGYKPIVLFLGLLEYPVFALFLVGSLVVIFGTALSAIASVYGVYPDVKRLERRARLALLSSMLVTLLVLVAAIWIQNAFAWVTFGDGSSWSPAYHRYYPVFVASFLVAAWDFRLRDKARNPSKNSSTDGKRPPPPNVSAIRYKEMTFVGIVVSMPLAPLLAAFLLFLHATSYGCDRCFGFPDSVVVHVCISPIALLLLEPFLLFRAIVEGRKLSSSTHALRGARVFCGKYIAEMSGVLSDAEADRHFRANTRTIKVLVGNASAADIEVDRSFAEPSTETWIAFLASPFGKRAFAHWSPGNEEWEPIEPYYWWALPADAAE